MNPHYHFPFRLLLENTVSKLSSIFTMDSKKLEDGYNKLSHTELPKPGLRPMGIMVDFNFLTVLHLLVRRLPTIYITIRNKAQEFFKPPDDIISDSK